MSTIEEAREQAREALELVHTWRQREQAWDTPRALDFARIGVSIRALLDATEPPVETGRIMLYHPDGSPKSNDEIRAEAEAASLSDQVDKPAEQRETEWEYRASHAWDGREVITTAPQGFSSEQWMVERRQVNPKKVLTKWLPIPDTTDNESEGKA